MLDAKYVLLIVLGIVGIAYCVFWIGEIVKQKSAWLPTQYHCFVGFVTDFLDTLGIGSFATTTSLYRLRKTVDDVKIPGTLNVGHALPTLAQAFIYISIVEVEIKTLCWMIGSSVMGAWMGAGIVTRLPRRQVQIGMGIALLVAVTFILRGLLFGKPNEMGTSGLNGWWLVIASLGTFTFGALMTIGVGAYAPIMIMVSLLGMNPATAFPIMMGSCAFLMPFAGIRFIKSKKYDIQAAVGLSLAGVPAVILAAYLLTKFAPNTYYLQWLVVVVVLYTALSMLWTGCRVGNRDDNTTKLHP